MYAIIRDRSKQYKVEPDMEFDIDLREEKEGDVITLDEVLYVNDGKNIKVGTPNVAGAKVTCEVIKKIKDRKVVVFKFKRRKNFKRKKGHRQQYVRVKVKEIKT
ncbi:MAG: 50S ribosomal protein L21 [Candidatus Omnitrophica bacterium]|nr:50S ribosomal protein L21 [Candidatus Omnitrophota bacterium]